MPPIAILGYGLAGYTLHAAIAVTGRRGTAMIAPQQVRMGQWVSGEKGVPVAAA